MTEIHAHTANNPVLRTVLFWVIMHRAVVISYQCFGKNYWSNFFYS